MCDHAGVARSVAPRPALDRPVVGQRPGTSTSAVVWKPGFRRVLVVPLLLAGLLAPGSATAQAPTTAEIEQELGEATDRRDQLEDELGAVTRDLGVVELELAHIGARLDDARARLHVAEGQVTLAGVALEEAEVARDEAASVHERSARLLEARDEALAAETDVLAEQVVHTFKYGSTGAARGTMLVEALRSAEDPSAFAVALKQLRTVVEDQDTVVATVADLRADRSSQADDAARSRGRATQTALDAADMLETVEELREVAAAVTAEIEHEERQEAQLLASLRISEADAAALAERAAARQEELERDLRDARQEERRRAARRAAAQEATAVGGPTPEGMPCPVVGAVAGRDFTNDWGFPRSGGRTHQGNDVFASRGTPVVAVADAEVVRWNPPSAPTRLGGITVTYRTSDGSEWYNAHLDTIAAGIAPGVDVARGEVIGTVGNTGNAVSTPPHLHLGRRTGGSWINPWPTISEVCR